MPIKGWKQWGSHLPPCQPLASPPSQPTPPPCPIAPTSSCTQIFNAYCTKKGLDPDAMKFLDDGDRIPAHQTPADREMEDGHVVSARCWVVEGTPSADREGGR